MEIKRMKQRELTHQELEYPWKLGVESGIPSRDIKGSSVTLSMKPLETSKPIEKDKKE